ncbi:sensor histidine kinase [Candidatus Halobonum tyrrellensis]|uniref:Signal transduction histidine kinase n=1 Tax=Candidatus Halobonum tyrrellensis G22 TaxID=1324957 RepID=V4IXK7_9EURY|nr:HAMP domain-containing sensor histidine kinase [Candidatus Halobonum tyrrellensis]ESP87892.1 signal transduction histidine kinase [Candidatus Halobonum tyrrellensis G22]
MYLRPTRVLAPERIPRLFEWFGLLCVVLIGVEWAVADVLALGGDLVANYLFAFVFSGVPALGISYAGYRLDRSDVEPDQYRRVARWCLGGLVGFLGLNLVLMAIWPMDSLLFNVGWARGTAIYGAAGGLLVGGIEARAVHRARVAERRNAHAEHLETQHQWLSYMNSLLRHEVLNTANVIEGYADLLLDEADDDGSRAHLETIRRQSRSMSSVIEDAQILLEATDREGGFERVDLSTVVAEQTAELRTRYDVAVDNDVPDGLTVVADDLCFRIFSNLLTNAVKHNDGDAPRVSVDAEVDAETVTVLVCDNGPGIPDSRREQLFDGETRKRTHGLGLYLVRTLAERYGGSVELRETGPEGSEFAVSLPRATGEASGSRTAVDADAGARGATGSACDGRTPTRPRP